MKMVYQSFVGRPAVFSGAAESPNTVTVSMLVDRYMLAYAGRDSSRTYRLQWWQSKIGDLPVTELSDDHVFHLLEELSERPARVFAGNDVDGKPIFRARSPKLSPATLNRYQHSLAAVCTWAIRKRLVPKDWEHPCKRIERRPENNKRVAVPVRLRAGTLADGL